MLFSYIVGDVAARLRLLHRNTILAVLVFSLLPNIIYLLISPWLMLRRLASPLIYILFAIPALLLSAPLAYAVFLLAVLIDVYLIVSLAFDMPFSSSFAALRHLADIDLSASLLYLGGCAAGLALAVLMGFLSNRYRAQLRSASLMPALVVAFMFCGFDLSMNGFKPLTVPRTFDSALQQNNITSDSIVARNRNVLIVMVEGMGAYALQDERALLERKLAVAAGDRYTLRHGTSLYYGSTTGAASRELCGRWATYVYYLAATNPDCLPKRLASAGYETVSFHAGYSDLFSRRAWHPKIGFQELNFREDIERSHPALASQLCGSVTVGLCDDKVGERVHQKLLQAGKRQFIYWLTLNSHVPYVPLVGGPLHCGNADAPVADITACQLTEIWMGVFDSVAKIANDPKMPPLDIVVVGDHNTPMWSRSAQQHFIGDKVDWYYLEHKGGNLPETGKDSQEIALHSRPLSGL
jgi:hypothetical protein